MTDHHQQQQQQQQLDIAQMAATHTGQQAAAAASETDAALQSSLGKLRNLNCEDKSELGLLRSRVEDQSHLIMMLKQRSDEHLVRAQTLERVNKELEQFKDEASERLDHEIGRHRVLEEQFETLASNHEQLIKFKDEYKQQNEWLQKENKKLRDHVDALIAAKLRDKEEAIGRLSHELVAAKQQLSEQQQQQQQLVSQLTDSQRQLSALIAESQQRDQQRAASDKQLQQLQTSAAADAAAWLKKEKELMKEKDDMLQLAMQRGKLCEDKQRELKVTKDRLLQIERQFKELQDRYDSELDSVNANVAVKRLRSELDVNRRSLQDLRNEFNSYKQHSAALLQKERELNATLRNNIA